jgi:hypothetical protein
MVILENKNAVFWYDSLEQINSWLPEYSQWLESSPVLASSKEYYKYCLSRLDYADVLGIQTKLVSDWIPNNDINIYPLSIQQLIFANFKGIGTVIDSISDDAKRLIRENKLSLLILNHREGWEESRYLSSIAEHLRYNDMENASVFVVSGNHNIKSTDFSKVFVSNEFETIAKRQNASSSISKPYAKKSYDFLCLNRLLRPHRTALYSELTRLGLLSRSAFSFIGETYLNKYPDDVILLDDDDRIQVENLLSGVMLDHFNDMHSSGKIVKREYDAVTNVPIPQDPNELYRNSYISLVTESHFSEKSAFISEKSFKPLIHYHPFLILGEHGILSQLRNMGYETFPELFDETYDTILDDKERFYAVVTEIKKWCEKTEHEKNKLIESVSHKLVANHSRFFGKTALNNKIDNNRAMFKEIGNISNEKNMG